MIICFCTGAEFAITRPSSSAIFITVFSTLFIPWVWLATVPLNLFAVYLYNRFLPKIGPLKMVITVAGLAIAVNVLCALLLPYYPKLIFFQFAWKDIYILFMFKQLWSMIHSTISASRAKYLYGIIFGMGTLGSIAGSAAPGFFAVEMGSARLLFLTAPIYAVLIFCYCHAMKYSFLKGLSFSDELTSNPKPGEGISMIFRNRKVLSIMLLVIFMQISVGLIEYQFNWHVQTHVADLDLRTEYCGKIFGLTSLTSGIFQFIGSFFLIHVMGVRRSHLFIPLLLLGNGLLVFMMPTFALVSFAFVFLKAIDFSLFGVVKEMLYIPLRLDEKYRAKAVIDVFAYRTSKAFIALAILALQFFLADQVLNLTSLIAVALFAIWVFFVVFFLRGIDEKKAIAQ